MPGKTLQLYVAPWVFFFILLAGLSAYLFVLSTHLDPDDPTSEQERIWSKVNYGVAVFVALLAIITVPLGILHQKKLKRAGWKYGKSPQEQADALAGQAQRFNRAQPNVPQYIQMVPMQVTPVQPTSSS